MPGKSEPLELLLYLVESAIIDMTIELHCATRTHHSDHCDSKYGGLTPWGAPIKVYCIDCITRTLLPDDPDPLKGA
jgi:hypothetical protein